MNPETLSNEHIVKTLSTHWIKYVWPAFMLMCISTGSVMLFLLAGLAAHHNMWISHTAFFIAIVTFFITHHWFFNKILSEYMIDIILTNKRIIFLRDSLLFIDDMHQIPLASIQGVEARIHGLLENILGYGSIWLDTGGSRESDVGQMIPQVPHPHGMCKEITQLLNMR